MTPTQKEVFKILLQDGNIAKRGTRFVVRDKDHNPIMTFGQASWFWIKRYCKPNKKKTLFVISRTEVRRLTKKSWLKKEYLSSLKN